MVANEVLKKITLSNVFVDAMNNTSGILQEEINHKTDYLLNNNTIGLLLDVAVVGMEYSPIPQVKAAGFLLDGIIVAADFYTLLKDNKEYAAYKNLHVVDKNLVLDPELREKLQKEDEIKTIDMTKLNMDSLHVVMDIADNHSGLSTIKYRVATTLVLFMTNGKIFYDTYLKDDEGQPPHKFLPPPLQKIIGDLFKKIPKAIDPVVLNLSEEGKAKSLENSFSHFDYDSDGFAEHTAWIGDKQGLLVVDINENGILNIIKFNSKKITSTDAEGNKLKSIGFFVRSDGTTGEIRDYYFETDEMNTFNKTRKYFLKLCLNIDNYILQEYYTPRLQMKYFFEGRNYGRNSSRHTRISKLWFYC